MKTIIEFDSEVMGDEARAKAALFAPDLARVIWQLDDWLREQYRRDREDMTPQKGEIDIEQAETVRNKLREIMSEKDLSFDSEIFTI